MPNKLIHVPGDVFIHSVTRLGVALLESLCLQDAFWVFLPDVQTLFVQAFNIHSSTYSLMHTPEGLGMQSPLDHSHCSSPSSVRHHSTQLGTRQDSTERMKSFR